MNESSSMTQDRTIDGRYMTVRGAMNTRFDDGTVSKLLRLGHAFDRTEYAVSIGFQGRGPVIVLDGKVITHRGMCWFDFCSAIRSGIRRHRVKP